MQAFLGATMAACLALWFVQRFAPLALAGALCVMLALQWLVFPQTGNHSYLELWVLFLLVFVGRSSRDEGFVLLATLRWMVAIMVFYTGLQKVLHGTYFDAQFLAFQILLKPQFAEVLRFERAVLATLIDDEPRVVVFEFDPLPMLLALAEGCLPDKPSKAGRFEIEITPDGPMTTSGMTLKTIGQTFAYH